MMKAGRREAVDVLCYQHKENTSAWTGKFHCRPKRLRRDGISEVSGGWGNDDDIGGMALDNPCTCDGPAHLQRDRSVVAAEADWDPILKSFCASSIFPPLNLQSLESEAQFATESRGGAKTPEGPGGETDSWKSDPREEVATDGQSQTSILRSFSTLDSRGGLRIAMSRMMYP